MPFKYFQKHTLNKSRLSDSLNSQRWRFLQRGAEDFREGFPPLHDSISTQRTKGGPTIPLILSSKPADPCKIQQQRSQKMLTKPHSYASKLSPMLQARKDCIAQVEYCLSQHPLALYPHLEDSVPPELFKEVIGVLDPEMLPISEEADEADVEEENHHHIPPATQSQLGVKRKEGTRTKFGCKDPNSKGPYTWFSQKEVAAREKEARLNYIPPLPENVRQATKEFCSWFDSLGGEKYNIDEATIISLFDAGYETRPPVSVPIHVMELDSLPAELRKSVGTSPPQASLGSISRQGSLCQESSQPKWEKVRYGAWYLNPKTWTKQKGNEPLADPKLEDTRTKNSRRALDEKDAEIMQLHGTHAFKEFLDRKGYRIPEFLQQMLVIQDATGSKVGAS